MRLCFWQNFRLFFELTPELVAVIKESASQETPPQALIDALKEAGWVSSCIINSLENYRLYDCSELGNIRNCLWEALKHFNWDLPIPRELLTATLMLGEKDLVLPSDFVIDKIERFFGGTIIHECVPQQFRKIRYCRPPCEQSSTTCPECPVLSCPVVTCPPQVTCPTGAFPALNYPQPAASPNDSPLKQHLF